MSCSAEPVQTPAEAGQSLGVAEKLKAKEEEDIFACGLDGWLEGGLGIRAVSYFNFYEALKRAVKKWLKSNGFHPPLIYQPEKKLFLAFLVLGFVVY